MKRFIRKNHEVYLIHIKDVHNKMKENKFLVDVKSILNKFMDVFMDEIEKFPIVRKLHHIIDFIANATLVARVPC